MSSVVRSGSSVHFRVRDTFTVMDEQLHDASAHPQPSFNETRSHVYSANLQQMVNHGDKSGAIRMMKWSVNRSPDDGPVLPHQTLVFCKHPSTAAGQRSLQARPPACSCNVEP